MNIFARIGFVDLFISDYMNFERAKKYLESFVSYEEMVKISYGEDSFDLNRVRNFLREFGVDYGKLKYVHVAGSKGKGSTCRMIADYLEKSGRNAGLYTSPHMKEVTERFWLNGLDISLERFAEYVGDLKKFIDERDEKNHVRNLRENLTYFEILTVIALKFFMDELVDYAVLEVGLGGRLDATNIVTPVLSVITSVELEHVGILGNNLREIIDEKLGIVKNGAPVLVGYQGNESLELIRKKMAGRKEVFYVQDFDSEFFDEIDWNFSDSLNVNFDQARVGNAKVAFTALKIILGNVDLKVFQKVVKEFKLPGRFDVRKVRGRTVVFDMAHTKSSVENLISALRDNFSDSSFVFLMAIMKGKDVQEILKRIDKIAGKIIFTNVHENRGIKAKDLRKIAGDMNLQSSIEVVENCTMAYENLLKNIKKNQILVVTGSHFLVGKLLDFV